MSIPVPLTDLADVVSRYRFGYLLTTGEGGPPRAVQVTVVVEGGDLLIVGVGRRTRENVIARPAVSLLWPPLSEADYSLIVDGQAGVVGESLRITPASAVLHRSSRPCATGASPS